MAILSPLHPGCAISINTDLPLRGSLSKSKEESCLHVKGVSPKVKDALGKYMSLLEEGIIHQPHRQEED